MMGWKKWEGARDRKEGRLRGRARGLSPMCLPPTCVHASLMGQLVWTLLSECSGYVLHRHSYTHVHIHGEAEEWHDQASAAKGSSFNYSQPLSVYKYDCTMYCAYTCIIIMYNYLHM